MNYRKIFLFALISVVALNATAQDNDTYDEQITVQQKKGEFEYSAETQGSFSHGKTPLWLNANKYGLSSLDETNDRREHRSHITGEAEISYGRQPGDIL